MQRIVTAMAFAVLTTMSGLTGAQSNDASATTASATASRAAALTDGEVRKVDKDAKKLTLRHGPLDNLGMPGMTMVFQVQDAAMLDGVKAGDQVKFAAEKIGGAFMVTRIESVN